jgi:hypothetical protein
MSDEDAIRFAGVVARAVLRRLGDNAPPWHVLSIERHHEVHPPPAGLSPPNSLLVTIGGADRNAKAIEVYFSLDVPREQAAEAMAGQIQDHVIEETQGRSIPPCPGHGHPLSTGRVDGVASWLCPRGADHHWEPILPRGDRDVRGEDGGDGISIE